MTKRHLKHTDRKVAATRTPPEQLKRFVLVGTYRGGQLEKWPEYYHYPLTANDKFNSEALKRINELWLFKGAKEGRYFKSEYVGEFTREELVSKYACPVGRAGTSVSPHGETYILYRRTASLYTPSEKADAVMIRTKDFARSPKVRKQLKAYLESPERTDPALAKYLPKIVAGVPRSTLCVCEPDVQTDFLRVFARDEIERKIGIAQQERTKAAAGNKLTCVEICAGAGGQAIGLDRAGFSHVALVEYEREYCDVLKRNNPEWNVICADVHDFDGRPFKGVDLLAGGVPCPPFSVASKQLGKDDERDLFPEAIRLVSEIRPRAVMIENVRGLLDPKFDDYRSHILRAISDLGYRTQIKLLQASDFGVPQIRPRVVIVGIRNDVNAKFSYPSPNAETAPTVGDMLHDMMASNGWTGADAWAKRANSFAPTIVGGSKKHGGPDLGPTRARRAWAELGVDGLGIANEPPGKDFAGNPRLTKEMIAIIQGFPASWNFGNKKTAACRMIGNAFPPPVAEAVGRQIKRSLTDEK